jgi:hypothetical protein
MLRVVAALADATEMKSGHWCALLGACSLKQPTSFDKQAAH